MCMNKSIMSPEFMSGALKKKKKHNFLVVLTEPHKPQLLLWLDNRSASENVYAPLPPPAKRPAYMYIRSYSTLIYKTNSKRRSNVAWMQVQHSKYLYWPSLQPLLASFLHWLPLVHQSKWDYRNLIQLMYKHSKHESSDQSQFLFLTMGLGPIIDN